MQGRRSWRAPWNVIPTDDKKSARIEALKAITSTLLRGIERGSHLMEDAAIADVEAHFGSLPDDL